MRRLLHTAWSALRPDWHGCRLAVGELVAREGHSSAGLLQRLLPAHSEERAALVFLLGEGPRPRLRVLRGVVERLEDLLDADLGSGRLRSVASRLGGVAATVVGAVAAVACGYIVIGGLIEGDSLLLGDRYGALGLALFLAVLSLLGLFEALHTSATMLKLADLDAVAERYPRAFALHRRFRTNPGLARFLAGRQMVVIVTVFFCSPLSSFPELSHWPLTGVPLPDVVRPLVAIGMPGALFVLWFGQLAPQFLATRHAVAFTNSRIVVAAFHLAYALESSGLARPGTWLASWDRCDETIPTSAGRRFKEDVDDLNGFGVVRLEREWEIDERGTVLHAATTTRIGRSGLPTLTDGSMVVPGAPATLQLDARGARAEGDVPLLLTEHREEVLPSGDRRFHKPAVPAVGSFRAGDSVTVTLRAGFASDPGRDVVLVDRPTRAVVLRVRPTSRPIAMRPALIRTYTIGDGLSELVESEPPLVLEPVWDGGRPVLEHVVAFPRAGTLLALEWGITPTRNDVPDTAVLLDA